MRWATAHSLLGLPEQWQASTSPILSCANQRIMAQRFPNAGKRPTPIRGRTPTRPVPRTRPL